MIRAVIFAFIVVQTHAPRPFDDGVREQIINFHNQVRRNVYPPAANMLKMRWDYDMENLARDWAVQCHFEHPWNMGISSAELSKYDNTSQSLVMQKKHGEDSIDQFLDALEKESKYYIYGSGECEGGTQCTHYVNLIRASSYRVACVKKFCPPQPSASDPRFREDWTIFVCQYSPGTYSYESGYGEKLDVPYKQGTPCSKCASDETCEDGLCVCGASAEPVAGGLGGKGSASSSHSIPIPMLIFISTLSYLFCLIRP